MLEAKRGTGIGLDGRGGSGMVGGGGEDWETMENLNQAASLLLLNRTLGGGTNYEEALEVAKGIVGLGGGPVRMLE